jgi:alpha-L-fucosidase 2
MMRVWLYFAMVAASLWPCMALAVTATVGEQVGRSDIAVDQPNILPTQAMGLGNGRFGVALWAADGLTVQLNRSDTLPGRYSPGQVVFPDLKPLVVDRAFHGKLDLYDGTLDEQGGGITLVAWVDHRVDRLIVDLSGLAPNHSQRMLLRLWPPRTPHASVRGDIGLISEDWLDDHEPGASGRRFGSLAAVRAIGRDAHARVIDALTVEVTARPTSDGHLRVVIAAPAFDGRRPAFDLAREALVAPIDEGRAAAWWHAFWSRARLIRAESADGTARYAETLRTLFLFASAAHEAGDIPGSQAGVADLFSSTGDDHLWDPGAFWFWNLRMQVGANLAAGLPELNTPVFALYRDQLDAIERWTRVHMGNRPGSCVPETMRFNGNGVEYESDRFRPFAIVTHSCDANWSAQANARTLSSGAEIGLWVWRTYLQTNDRAFLQGNYPLMAQSARFLLSYQKPGADGLLHTAPSNAHETQMDVTDPATDLAAIHALYPATIDAATLLRRDPGLVAALEGALRKTPSLPVALASQVASPSPAALPTDRVLAASHDPASPYRNGENIGLEAVWPYDLIGLDSPLFAIARRTYALRPFVFAADWSDDPVQAARLGLGSEVSRAIFHLVQLYQIYPNGMASLVPGAPNEFYLEQAGVTALALSEVLAIQDDDGLIRVGPALPPGWTMSGTVALRHGMTIDVEVIDGQLTAFTVHHASSESLRFATPWKYQTVISENGKPMSAVHGGRFSVPGLAGHDDRFAPVGNTERPDFVRQTLPTVKSLGRATIGLGPPCCAPPPGYDPRSDR